MSIRRIAAAALLLALALPFPAAAQQQDNLNLGAVISVTSQTAATVTGTPTPNTSDNGAICTLAIAANSSSGSPSITFAIQFQDTVSAAWQSLVTSGAITNQTATSIMVYPGAVATSVPSGMVIAGLKLPRVWRVSATVAGTGAPNATFTVGCDLLR